MKDTMQKILFIILCSASLHTISFVMKEISVNRVKKNSTRDWISVYANRVFK